MEAACPWQQWHETCLGPFQRHQQRARQAASGRTHDSKALPVLLQVAERPAVDAQTPSPRLDAAIAEFAAIGEPQERLKLLLEYGKQLKPMAADAKTDANRVMGCTAQVACPASQSCRLCKSR